MQNIFIIIRTLQEYFQVLLIVKRSTTAFIDAIEYTIMNADDDVGYFY